MNTNPNACDRAIFKSMLLNPAVTTIDENHYLIASTSNPDVTYSVTLPYDITMDGATCTCPAYTLHEPPHPYCVHRAAAHVARVQEYARKDFEQAKAEAEVKKVCTNPTCANAKFLDDLCPACLEDFEQYNERIITQYNYDDFAAHNGKL